MLIDVSADHKIYQQSAMCWPDMRQLNRAVTQRRGGANSASHSLRIVAGSSPPQSKPPRNTR